MDYCIYNEDCNKTMHGRLSPASVDVVLTSPPYCTSNRAGRNSKMNLTKTNADKKYYPYLRYDVFSDNMEPEEYVNWTVKLFEGFDRILKPNGCVLYNISYSSGNVEMLFQTVAAVIDRTEFTLADMIGWKKRCALPNNLSPNRLTRIFEPVFVFCRRSESGTFFCNKPVASIRKTGQKSFANIFNFIDARNNDGPCELNRATYSSELCEKLLSIYAKEGFTVYDPFMGTGTTAVACKKLGMDCFGSEISAAQIDFAYDRIDKALGYGTRRAYEPLDFEPVSSTESTASAKPSEESHENGTAADAVETVERVAGKMAPRKRSTRNPRKVQAVSDAQHCEPMAEASVATTVVESSAAESTPETVSETPKTERCEYQNHVDDMDFLFGSGGQSDHKDVFSLF